MTMRHLILATGMIMAAANTVMLADRSEKPGNAAGGGGSGASVAWTTDDPTILKARQMFAAGEYAKAEKLLHALQAAGGSGTNAQARDEMLELIRCSRLDYATDDAALLEKL